MVETMIALEIVDRKLTGIERKAARPEADGIDTSMARQQGRCSKAVAGESTRRSADFVNRVDLQTSRLAAWFHRHPAWARASLRCIPDAHWHIFIPEIGRLRIRLRRNRSTVAEAAADA